MKVVRSDQAVGGNGSGTQGCWQSLVDHPEGVSASSVDTHPAGRTSIVQVSASSECAPMDTPTAIVSGTPSEQQRRPDRRSVRRHDRQDSPRHTEQRDVGQEDRP